MHALAAHLPVLLAATKSRTAFYIVGSVLVVWALVVSLGLGLRKVDFPRTRALERIVMLITAVLVVGTGATAIITASTETKSTAAAAPAPPTRGAAARSGVETSLSLEASKTGLAYNKKELSANAGKVTITFTNESAVEHNLTVSKPGLRVAKSGEVLGATPTFKGGSRKLTLSLPAGKYTYYCSVPGHREAGMEGTLTVH
jgi:plastocyanin